MRKSNKAQATRAKDCQRRKIRVTLAFFALLLWFTAVGGRLVQLTLYSDQRVAEYAERQNRGSVKTHLPRGMIFDRNGAELAVSIEMNSAYINPKKVADINATARKVARALEPSRKKARQLEKRIARAILKRKHKSFAWLRRKITPDAVTRLKKENIAGIGFVKESKRFYPKRDVAAKIIGFSGMDNQGLSGLEYYYDREIHPVSPRFTVIKDALGRAVSMPEAMTISEESAPLDLMLTIDERIQYIAESSLERQVLKTSAKGGVAIVMEPNSGEILAIAEMPKYNPNNFRNYSRRLYRSKAVSIPVEPGSTFKLFVAATALEKEIVDPGAIIDCERGRYKVASHTYREANLAAFDALSVSDVIEKSSNIGAIKIAQMVGPERLRDSLERFGFGARSGVDLPGESPGQLRPVTKWSQTSLPSISFGQEVGVTPLQLIAGVSVFANGGYLVKPHLVRAFYRDGQIKMAVKPHVKRKVLSKRTVAAIASMMEKVVVRGTGKMGAVKGFNVAGKTGTAQKIDRATKTYSESKFLASFVGFLPLNNPRLAILVMIDEPEGVAWGGSIAGPVFAEIARRATRILNIPSSYTEVYEIDWEKMQNRSGAEIEASVNKEREKV